MHHHDLVGIIGGMQKSDISQKNVGFPIPYAGILLTGWELFVIEFHC
jgi:hypothetical protein